MQLHRDNNVVLEANHKYRELTHLIVYDFRFHLYFRLHCL